jgi:hypothetical protein
MTNHKHTIDKPGEYCICVQGRLDETWFEFFAPLAFAMRTAAQLYLPIWKVRSKTRLRYRVSCTICTSWAFH